jgi:subtilisin family serine protease
VFNGFRIRVRANRLNRIARIKGVKAIYAVPIHTRSTLNSVPYIGADATWGQTRFTGRGVTIAVIDSGINYDHLDFNGRGFAAWQANDPTVREPGTFPTGKVVDGWDLVGDDYDADDEDNDTPQPDPDPLDCKARSSPNVQHGTHVAGIAAGVGVTDAGQPYSGPYNANTLDNVDFRIGPGIAPEARLMAFRVFGCQGSSAVVVDAIERAVRAGADVINMSLGSPLGNPGSLDAIASNNASIAGVVVVTSSGNEGPSAYVTGTPGVATRAISTAAMDALESFPGARIDFPTGNDMPAINANNSDDLPVSGVVNHFRDDPGTPTDSSTGEGGEHLGCHSADYAFNNFRAGQIAVVQRGICARVDRAIRGTDEGAAAVIMVNNAPVLPPFEDAIPGASIPFIGVRQGANGRLRNADGDRITIRRAGRIDNATFAHTADFTSAGPRRSDSMIKPDVAAPGVSVFSADGGGTGNGKSLSGTSMASPAVAGVAALVLDAHPDWAPHQVKGAIVGTAQPGKVDPYQLRFSGAGVVRPRRAVDTRAFAFTPQGASSLTFGAREAGDRQDTTSFAAARKITIENTGSRAIRYSLSNQFNGSSQGVSVSISPRVLTVPAGGTREVTVRIRMNQSAAGELPDTAPDHGPALATDDFGQNYQVVDTVGGAIVADPSTSGTGIYPLRIPWLVVPRGLSDIRDVPGARSDWTVQGGTARASLRVRNGGVHRGWADIYSWGLTDDEEGYGANDLRAGGVQTTPARVCSQSADPEDRCLIFAINTHHRWSSPAERELDVLIDYQGDGTPEFVVVGVDEGVVFGVEYGVPISLIIDLRTGDLVNVYYASGGSNGSTLLLPVLASDLGLSRGSRASFQWWAESYNVYDPGRSDGRAIDLMFTGNTTGSGLASYHAFSPVLNNGTFVRVGVGSNRNIPLGVSLARYDPEAGHHGWMLVTLDDASGAEQADLIPVGQLP